MAGGVPGAEAEERAPRHARWLLGGVLLLVVLTRLPFLSMTLAGEEGSNGRGIVMMAQGKLPRSPIARSSRGDEFLMAAGHNLGGYLLPGALLNPVLHVTGFSRLEQRVRAATGLRGCYVVIYCLALLVAFTLMAPQRRARGTLVLAALSLPTLPLLASVQVNYDGAVTPLLVVTTLLLFRRAASRLSVRWACAAGALLSFGKLEYVVAVTSALGVSELVERRARLWLVFVASLVVGIFIWRALDPVNFGYGYDVIGRFWDLSGGTRAPILSRALAYARNHFAMLWPTYAVTLTVLVVCAVRRRSVRTLLPVGLSMLFIMLGYHAIAWRGDNFPRYLAPCFPLAAVLLTELEAPRFLVFGLAAAVILVSVPAYKKTYDNRERALASLIGAEHDDLALAKELEEHPRDCMLVTGMDSGVAFYSSRASFSCCFAQWTDWHAQHHERLCP